MTKATFNRLASQELSEASFPRRDNDMQWQEIRERHPHQWLLTEAIAAHSAAGERIVEDLAVLETYPDGRPAMHGYREVHRRDPQRELYVLHTDRERLEITEQRWLGIRTAS